MLRRHLMTHYGITPDEYRAKWNLPKDYPMVAPNYAETRRALAKQIGLGTKGRGGGRKPAARGTKSGQSQGRRVLSGTARRQQAHEIGPGVHNESRPLDKDP